MKHIDYIRPHNPITPITLAAKLSHPKRTFSPRITAEKSSPPDRVSAITPLLSRLLITSIRRTIQNGQLTPQNLQRISLSSVCLLSAFSPSIVISHQPALIHHNKPRLLLHRASTKPPKNGRISSGYTFLPGTYRSVFPIFTGTVGWGDIDRE